MVKEIDGNGSNDDAPDHVGWALWQCCAAWKRRFGTEMRDAGYPAFAEARGSLLMHVGPGGIGQTELVALTGLTKQAVQQALEILEAEGLVQRTLDPDDARKRRVVRTEEGRAAFAKASAVKKRIDADLTAAIGAQALTEFRSHLAATLACFTEDPKKGPTT